MSDSVYKVIDLVGASTTSWEDAANKAIAKLPGPFGIFGSPRCRSWTSKSKRANQPSFAPTSVCPLSIRINQM